MPYAPAETKSLFHAASLKIVMNLWVFAGSHLEAISFVDAKRKEQVCIPLGFFLNTASGNGI